MSKEILIIRLSSIGDVIHCTPVASSLKAAWPDCKITWMVGGVSADLLQGNPYIDEIIIWSREKFEDYLRNFKFREALRMWRDLKKQLKDRQFDAVLDIHGLFLTGMIAKQANTKKRIGMKGTKELNSHFMTQTGEALSKHITDKYLAVLPCLGIEAVNHKMSLVVPEEARKFARDLLQQYAVLPDEKIVVLILGTTWITKNWPIAFFIETAKLLGKDFRIILCGGKAEVQLGKEVETKAGVPVINTIGQTSLLEMAGIIEQASVVVSGDTGPLHMAGALEVPTVGMFGPTDPATYAPQGEQHEVLSSTLSCSYCHKRRCPKEGEGTCMESITPEAVVQKVYEILKRGRA
ncbi:glycosyltransferase family 9 protein [Pelosinus fermentans]|uniref:Glycosyl transferase family 9 n=1 Tax=Pelosinus fermentans JBW45 TaxID=1192197 RepID=I8U098_9FIRM|nr:glycosyltransferase family 9 protein [Pelosinus fermentans]AJQ28854.1 glycosyl transferase family 9 [Pelosinus fermentans JBW45]